jgi:CPA1 family monovalent cation:H+ antiporter
MGAAFSGDAVPRPEEADGDRDDDYRERLARLKRRREQWTRLQAVALAAARREVVAARGEPGTDPEVADRVLRRLDVRSLARGL